MKQFLLSFFFIMTGAVSVLAQTLSLETTPIISEDVLYDVAKSKIVGINKDASSTSLYYSFSHPRGGVQKVNGSILTGGKEPTELKAFGQINISGTGVPETLPVQWIAQRHGGTNINYLAKPLIGAITITQEPLAKPGQFAVYDTLKSIEQKVTIAAAKLSPLSQGEEKKEEGAEELSFINEYYETSIILGLSGGISQINTLTHALRSEEEMRQSYPDVHYKTYSDYYRDDLKKVFGANNVSFKLSAGTTPTLSDPFTGNAIVMGGVKYKKDKTKENSEFTELRLLTFNSAGETVNSVSYESDQPISIETIYPIYGREIAPTVFEVTHGVVIAYGNGNRKMTNVNEKHYKVLIIDIETGEIVAENGIDLPHRLNEILKFHRLPNNELEILYCNKWSNDEPRGLSLINIGLDAQITQKQFDGNSPEVKSLDLLPGNFRNLKAKLVNDFPLADGSGLMIKNLIAEVSTKIGEDSGPVSIGLAAFKYDSDGHLETVRGIGGFSDAYSFNLLTVTEDRVVFYEHYRREMASRNRNRIRFTSINRQTLEVETSDLHHDYFLTDYKSFLLDTENKEVLFLTQRIMKKGLYLSRFKY